MLLPYTKLLTSRSGQPMFLFVRERAGAALRRPGVSRRALESSASWKQARPS